MRALAIAATGMSAQQQNIEVISHNIANINTTGFKRSRAEFTDLLYQTDRLQGVSNRGRDATVPQGSQFGLGVRTAAVRSLQQQGALTNTGNNYDLSLTGSGWFQILGADNETVYTRAGSFSTNANGQLVTVDGYQLNPTVTIPHNALSVSVSQTGVVTATIAGQTAPQQVGQLTIATFPNSAGLEAVGGNLFRETAASGQPVVGVPGDPGFGVINQGYLESSNVDRAALSEVIAAAADHIDALSAALDTFRPVDISTWTVLSAARVTRMYWSAVIAERLTRMLDIGAVSDSMTQGRRIPAFLI